MPGNTIGTLYKLTSFGESHGKAIGGIIDGCPPGIDIDIKYIQAELDRRKPGQSEVTTSRGESDRIEILSGIYEGKTLGTPIGFVIWNKESRSSDYDHLKNVYRPSHADFTYEKKYGVRDHRGGGRSSARETVARVVAGAIAKSVLKRFDIETRAYVRQIGEISVKRDFTIDQLNSISENELRCPDESISNEMKKAILKAKDEGDSLGGIIHCIIDSLPAGLGEPVFDKFHAQLGKAVLSINAVKGIEFGSGFQSVTMKGSEHNDEFYIENDKIRTQTNYSGGIQGGITNGETVYFNVAFKPTASIKASQKTIDSGKKEINLNIEGRHDPCVLPRAVPIVEAMTAIVTLDFLLMQKAKITER